MCCYFDKLLSKILPEVFQTIKKYSSRNVFFPDKITQSKLSNSLHITLDRKFEAVGCVTCFITVKLRPLTLQQNINENLAQQTVRKYLMKVALSFDLYLPSFFRAKLVNSKNGQKNGPGTHDPGLHGPPTLWIGGFA